MIRKTVAALASIALSGCASLGDQPVKHVASAQLMLANDVPVGTAQLVGRGDQLSLVMTIAGVSQGTHGVHLHTTGNCEAPSFTSAGGHLNPGGKQHGMDNPMGRHLGDLPNLEVGASGTGTLTAELPGAPDWLLAEMFDADGTAIVIHAGPDDYKTDPSGNSGSRIACGVLKRG